MKYIRPERVKHALNNIHNWAITAKFQAAAHILPTLALLEKDIGVDRQDVFKEKDDFAFWGHYFYLGDSEEKPYFNPITLRRCEKGFPHSNVATIRKNTFWRKWNAAKLEEADDGESWKLQYNYADILQDKVLRKSGRLHKIPILDLAILLFRNEEFPDVATSQDIIDRFRKRFPQRDEDFNKLFSINEEDPLNIFTQEDLDVPAAINTVIANELISDTVTVPSSVKSFIPPEAIKDDDDPVLIQVMQLLKLGTSGIILNGPPGTGKTWYAKKIAARLVNESDKDIFSVQFHPSYGYEDFVEGFKPDDSRQSGFDVVRKRFLIACDRADEIDGYVIVIIDEINRGDPARIFGELLTYLEIDYRNLQFNLPFSGDPARIPENLLILGTMNPFDRSVAQIDAAFVRRFDHIHLEPSTEIVQQFLEKSDFNSGEIDHIINWFEDSQNLLDIGLGHSFFKDVRDLDSLKLIWTYRIKPTAETILEYNPENKSNFINSFNALIARLEGARYGEQ